MSSIDCKVLDHEVVGIVPTPSTTIFFKRYPYRLRLEVKRKPKTTTREIKDFIATEIGVENTRTTFNNKGKLIYFKEYNHLVETATVFTSLAKEISGPVSNTHLQMLNDPYNVECRDHLYYHKYNFKMEVMLLSPYFIKNAYVREEVFAWIKDFLGKDNFKVHSRNTFYMTYENYTHMLPFLLLTFPHVKLFCARCIINDK